MMDGELGPYHFIRSGSPNPECFFEVRLAGYESSNTRTRQASWRPTLRREYDPRGWFAALNVWNPKHDPPPSLPSGARHFLVVGHDSYVEVLSSSYGFERVPPVAT